MERWTISVCPDCGRAEGDTFEYEPADDAWVCAACDNYPSRDREVEVVPAQQLHDAEAENRELRAKITETLNGLAEYGALLLTYPRIHEAVSRLEGALQPRANSSGGKD